ncbi:MAG: ornithine--oxo-acid transaminase, partial [Methylocystis sp.]
ATHHTVVRLAPPFVISQEDLDLALDAVEETISKFHAPRNRGAADVGHSLEA